MKRRIFSNRQSFEAKLERMLESLGIQLVCLDGWGEELSPEFVEHWRDRMVASGDEGLFYCRAGQKNGPVILRPEASSDLYADAVKLIAEGRVNNWNEQIFIASS